MTPRSNQIEVANKLVAKGKCILQATCGFGKTITGSYAYTLIANEVDYLYVVCPASVIPKFKSTLEALGVPKYKVLISSWAGLPKDTQNHILIRDKKYCLIIDECHRLRKYTSVRSNMAIRVAKLSKYLFMMSATPTQNRPSELYWLLKLCGAFGDTIYNFKYRYCGGTIKYSAGGSFVVEGEPTNQEELEQRYRSVTVYGRRRGKLTINFKTHILDGVKQDLPSFKETAKFRKEAGDIKKVAFIEAFKKGHIKGKALVFCHHISVIKYVAKNLSCEYIKGGFTLAKKEKILNDFLNTDQQFLVLGITASGEGIDIPNITTCYFVELTYSPKKDEQAYMRMVRNDLEAEINVFYLLLDTEHAKVVQVNKEEYLNKREET